MTSPTAPELIRPATDADLQAIHAVHVEAFGGRPAEAHLVDLLHAAGKARPSLVATINEQVVAHVTFSPVDLVGTPHPVHILGLAPLAVRPAHQRRGIGSRLAQAGLDACRADHCDAVVVLGDPAFYGRFGFRPARALCFTNEYVDDDDFMILELLIGSLSGLVGLLKYAPEFRDAGC